jgi:hypothetical protein
MNFRHFDKIEVIALEFVVNRIMCAFRENINAEAM